MKIEILESQKTIMLCLIMFLSLSVTTYGQTKIKLKTTEPFGDFELINAKDSAFIYTGYSGDMGTHYSPYHNFHDSIPDGKYEVYIDDRLDLIAYFKNKLRDSMWTDFHTYDTLHWEKTFFYKDGLKDGEEKTVCTNGEISIMNFKKGKADGRFVTYYPSGQIYYEGELVNNLMPIRTYYYENGNLKHREYFTNGNRIKRREYFDTDGNLTEIRTHGWHRKNEKFEDHVLNGNVYIPFYQGWYEIVFENNKILKLKMYDNEAKIIYEY